MPLHIVFMELIIDPVCSIAFESEREELGIMKRPPRSVKERFFGWNKIFFSLFKGVLLLVTVITVYFISIQEGHSDGEVRAIAFSALIVGNVFLIFNSLSYSRSFISVIKERNPAVFIIMIIALTALVMIISIPFLQSIFSMEYPGYQHFISALSGTFIMLGILEVIKRSKKYLKVIEH